ncbi:circumsporozoite protein-like isoform X3 [Setaria italica]|uniref:circumsporozoite protein-like isoform X3 n=1 Tax=Setaria italica TaxID=4555 RepID=UPI000BE5A389|nr:circumsporozoite protein-like isoform X3 [Setaria italica]
MPSVTQYPFDSYQKKNTTPDRPLLICCARLAPPPIRLPPPALSGEMDGDGDAGLGGVARETLAGLGAAPSEPPAGLGAAPRAAPAGLGGASRAAPAGLAAVPRAAPSSLGSASRAAPAGLGGASRVAPAGLGGAARAAPAGLAGAPRAAPAGLGGAPWNAPAGLAAAPRAAAAGLAGAPRDGPAVVGGVIDATREASGMEQDDFGAQDDGDQGLAVGGRGRDRVGGRGRGRVGQGGGRGRGCGAGHGSEKASKRNAPDTGVFERLYFNGLSYVIQGDSIEWTDANTTIICSLFAKQVKKGNRPNTHLNSVGYDEVSNEFFNLTAIRLTKRQMKNKWDKLKIDLTTWKKLMRKQTGAGWDRARGVIDMDDEWWKKARAEIPGCGKFRKKPLQNEEDLTVMFADITNDESDHWNPMSSNPIIPPTQEDVDNGHVNEVHDVPDDCDDGGVAWDETDEVQEVK